MSAVSTHCVKRHIKTGHKRKTYMTWYQKRQEIETRFRDESPSHSANCRLFYLFAVTPKHVPQYQSSGPFCRLMHLS